MAKSKSKVSVKKSAEDIKVRAIEKGFYGDNQIEPGQVFLILSEDHFSSKWMEKVGKDVELTAPKKSTPIDSRLDVLEQVPEVKSFLKKQEEEKAKEVKRVKSLSDSSVV